MLRSRFFRLGRGTRLCVPVLRCLHYEFNADIKATIVKKTEQPQNPDSEGVATAGTQSYISQSLHRKYKVFRDEEAPEIFDVEEEQQLNQYQTPDEPESSTDDEFLGLNVARGNHGVFDIEDLVDVLRKENAEDIFVCAVPADIKYVDYMVVCNGRSYRHMLAMASFVRRMYKIKRHKGDLLPKIEGEKNRDWMAMDMGNIVLHIFSPKCREQYDLESLWAIGSQYDRETNKPEDPLVKLYATHVSLLAKTNAKTTAPATEPALLQ